LHLNLILYIKNDILLKEKGKNFNPGIRSPLYFIRKGLYKKIKQYAPLLNGKLLDFGCGAKPYEHLFTNADSYVGVDYMSEGHDHANEKIDFYYDGHTLPFADDEFDAIFSSEVFEHIFNLPEILKELNRVLKPGGQLLLTCPFAWPEHEVPADYARYTKFALKDMLEKNCFIITTNDKSGDFATTIFQLKILYFRDHRIAAVPLLGKLNLFGKFCRQIIIPAMNIYYSILHKIVPKRQDLYLNNIILAKKKEK